MGEAIEVFSTSSDLRVREMPLISAFNPACMITEKGTLLAFAEGRFGSSNDNSDKSVQIYERYIKKCTEIPTGNQD